MTHELVPNTPCPHCERQNTTLRIALQDHGFTKLSRRCTSCGNEWTHTWDRDWLADAKIKRLSAENIELRAEVERLRQEDTRTRHALNGWVWVCPDGGDEPTHERVSAVVSEVEKQRAERERLRAALESIRIDGPDVVGLVWVSFVGSEEAARGHVAVGEENCLASRAALTFEEIRRKALEAKP